MCLNLFETTSPQEQFSKDKRGPAVADDVLSSGNRAKCSLFY